MQNTTIKSLHVRAVRLPMITPHRTASGVITESPLVLTDIETSDGIIGHSMIFTYTPMALKPVAEFISNLEDSIVGEALASSDIAKKLQKQFRLLGTQGLVGMALAAIDMAVWDALARTQNLPLVELLGGEKKPTPAYGAIGYDGAKVCAEVAEQWAKQGFTGIKAKIGYPTVSEDVEVIRAMRKAVGSDVAIMVDYNQSLTTTEAIERLKVLDDENLTWVEEPTLAHDYKGHAQISHEINTPIQCGENWWGALDMQHAIEVNASDYMMLDVMKIGGVTGWLQAVDMATTKNIPISNHLWPEISARLLCCTPTAHWLEYSDWWNPVLVNPLQIKDGMVMVDDSIGSGIEWNESIVKKYTV